MSTLYKQHTTHCPCAATMQTHVDRLTAERARLREALALEHLDNMDKARSFLEELPAFYGPKIRAHFERLKEHDYSDPTCDVCRLLNRAALQEGQG